MNGAATAFATAPTAEVEALDREIHRAFDALPVMRLTRLQVRRLWPADDATITIVLDRLLADGYLVLGADGRVGRWPQIGDIASRSRA